jgi:hypothetical protein
MFDISDQGFLDKSYAKKRLKRDLMSAHKCYH